MFAARKLKADKEHPQASMTIKADNIFTGGDCDRTQHAATHNINSYDEPRTGIISRAKTNVSILLTEQHLAKTNVFVRFAEQYLRRRKELRKTDRTRR